MSKNEFEIELIRLGFYIQDHIFGSSIFIYKLDIMTVESMGGTILVNDVVIHSGGFGVPYADILSIINSELRSIKLKKLLNG